MPDNSREEQLVNFCEIVKGKTDAAAEDVKTSAASGGQTVDYHTTHPVGTIVINDRTGAIHVVRDGGKATFYPGRQQ